MYINIYILYVHIDIDEILQFDYRIHPIYTYIHTYIQTN